MNFRRGLSVCSALVSALVLSSIAASAETSPSKNVFLIVPAGASVSEIQRVRSAVPRSYSTILVGAEIKISVREGVSILADQTFSSAGQSDALVVLPGPLSDEILAFLSARRGSARIIVLLGDSPAAERLRLASGGALIVTGSASSLPALLESAEQTKAEPSPTKPALAVSAPPSAPAPSRSVFDRYFSTASSTSHQTKTAPPN